jgi:hypothetical protein
MKRLGITEKYWKDCHEDHRFYWKLFMRAVAIAASFFVAKTGFEFFDKLVMIFTAVLPMLITESQRSYSKFSTKLGRNILRACVLLSTWGTAFIGLAIYIQISLSSVAKVYVTEILPQLIGTNKWFSTAVMLGVFLYAIPVATWRVFRNLDTWELIYRTPKRGLIRLLGGRKFVATNFQLFAYFELTVIVISFVYASTLSSAIQPYIALLRVV